MTASSLEVRRAEERGVTDAGWLYGRHSFSFGRYHDPDRMGYRALRVINDDVVKPARGFAEHGHDNMEILTWVLEGALKHRDSTGGGGVIRPGDLQAMTAGSGVRHSEMNASTTEPVRLLQIWIEPAERDLAPGYQQKRFREQGRRNAWQTVAAPDGRDGALPIHQDAVLSIADLDAGARLRAAVPSGRHGYLHVAFGAVRAGDLELKEGDAAAGPVDVEVEATERSQLLLFDLA